MKIDLHCHTIKTKTGESEAINVTLEQFKNTLEGRVKIVAITNHNYFDKTQYLEFKNNTSIELWPGIELDILEEDERYHVVIISNPDFVDDFEKITKEMIKANADSYSLSVEELINKFEKHDCIFLVHYLNKNNSFPEELLDKLKTELSEHNIIVEPSNLRSASILQSHNYISLVGSDVKDWTNYPLDKLPTMKINFSGYKDFKSLLQKKEGLLKTILEEELYFPITVEPFKTQDNDNHALTYNIYKDINVFFGGKGTGKSDILQALKEILEGKEGKKHVSYYKGKEVTKKFDDLVKEELTTEEINSFNLPNVDSAILSINDWEESGITLLSEYEKWKKSENWSKNNKKLGFREASFTDIVSIDEYEEIKSEYSEFISQSKDVLTEIELKELLTEEKEIIELNRLFEIAQSNYYTKVKKEYIKYKSLHFEKYTINKIKEISENKTGAKTKPNNTGFYNLYTDLKELQYNIKKLLSLRKIKDKSIKNLIGHLEDKGIVEIEKSITFEPDQTGFKGNNSINKDNLIKIYKLLEETDEKIYTEFLLDKLSDLKRELDVVKSVESFIRFKSEVILDGGSVYNPSDGEQSMLMLNYSIIDENYKIYILDEPELSVGHQYVNNIIIPQLKKLAKKRKVIIIATHDPNIAIRTLPYLSVYRKYENGVYYNYIGSSLKDTLYDSHHKKKEDWVEASISTLEGGRDAFDERGRIYG